MGRPNLKSAVVEIVGHQPAMRALSERERVSDDYWREKDSIRAYRLRWRAQTIRNMLHIVPGETILELGCGSGGLTAELVKVTRGECPITAVTFNEKFAKKASFRKKSPVEWLQLSDLSGALAGRRFDHVVGVNLLDSEHGPWVLENIQSLLKPGGWLCLLETNPWNPLFAVRRRLTRWLPFLAKGDEKLLPSKPQLYELLSDLGYVAIRAICYDFLYPPIPRPLLSVSRNASVILENIPIVRNAAGTILLTAQTPPRSFTRRPAKMTEHEDLHASISLVVPCHNEEMNIEPLIDALLAHYGDYFCELIFVDDNSTDNTRGVLRRMEIKHKRVKCLPLTPPNGVGRAIRAGLERSTGKYVLLSDCDFLQILPELRDMFDAIRAGNDVVIGSRFSRETVLINYPVMKILYNRLFHILASLLFHRRLRDLTNNLKLMKREVADNLSLESPWFSVNAETGLKPLLMGYTVHHSPISWIDRAPTMGKSSFSLLKNGLGYVKVLVKLAWLSRLGFRKLPRKR
jgi:dolichol-phosphate mannosyltransferase